jgi:hypothetical protein
MTVARSRTGRPVAIVAAAGHGERYADERY